MDLLTRRPGWARRAASLFRGVRWGAALAVALVAFAGFGATHPADADAAQAAAVKTAFVFNFAKFTMWPAEGFPASDSPIVFCVRRGSLDDGATATLDGKTLQERPVRVHVFEGVPPAPCHLIYVSRPAGEAEIRSLIEFARRAPALVVSDLPGFAEMGGHIALFERDGRLGFKINLATAGQSGLELSSKLLQLAVIVGP